MTEQRNRPPRSESLFGSRWLLMGLALVVAIGVAFGLSSILTLVVGGSPADVTDAMVRGSVGSSESIATTLGYTAILLVVALGTSIAGRAGLLNIGQEGQLIIGALCGAALALKVQLPPLILIPGTLLAAFLGGAVWAGIAALFKYWRNVHEAISSLLLIFVAFQIVSFAVNRPWLLQEHVAPGQTSVTGTPLSMNPQSDSIPENLHLPDLLKTSSSHISSAILVAIILTIAVMLVFHWSSSGIRLRMLGLNPRAAQTFGVKAWRYGGTAFVVSGGFAGLAGGLLLLGDKYRLESGFSGGFGWSGLLVALVAGFRPGAAIAVALLFGALRAGGGVLASTGVDSSIVDVIQALLVCAALVPGVVRLLLVRRANRTAVSRSDGRLVA